MKKYRDLGVMGRFWRLTWLSYVVYFVLLSIAVLVIPMEYLKSLASRTAYTDPMYHPSGPDLAKSSPTTPAADGKLMPGEVREKGLAAETKAMEEKELDPKIGAQFGWRGEHRALEEYILARVADPDSYHHIDTVFIERWDHLVVRMRFRVKNGFARYVRRVVWAKISLDGIVKKILIDQPY